MKRLIWILALLTAPAFAQNVRWDLPITTTQAQGGNLLPVYAVPGALVSFYNEPSGTLATTYNSATSTSACPTGSQVVLNGSGACVSSADPFGNMGSWFLPGQYMATITARGQSYNYLFTISGSSSGTGVTSITPGSGLSCSPLVGSTCTGAVTVNISSPLTITSFSGCAGTVEFGQNIVNPSFAATYSTTPASANITNTDGISSPTALSTPFTSGSVTGTFTHNSVVTTTFTLTAMGSSTQTATCTDTWQPRIFGGIGTSGATGATASGTTAVLTGATGTLPSIQLGAETVGQSLGSYQPSGQNIYVFLIGGSHTFTDACTGFPLPFNAATSVSFVNAQGATVAMKLYQSTNSLTYTGGCAFTPRVAS